MIDSKPMMGDMYLLEKKMEILLESIHKKMVSEFTRLSGTVDKLNNEIMELRRTVVQSAREEPVQVQPAYQQPAYQQPVIQPQVQQPTVPRNIFQSTNPANDTPVRPRSGDLSSKDVPIEKFFYFGNKR